MKTRNRIFQTLLGIGVLGSITVGTAEAGPIRHRKENQQQRIAQGVHSGQLTAGETANLERKEVRLNREQRDMRQDSGGKLTAGQRQKLNRQQNRLSHNIYRDKHNGRTRR